MFILKNRLHAILWLCAVLTFPSMVLATPSLVQVTAPAYASRVFEVFVVAKAGKVPGQAGSVITKVDLYMDGILQVITPTIVVTPKIGNPTTYTYKFKLNCVPGAANGISHIFTAKATENSVPATFLLSTGAFSATTVVTDEAPAFEESGIVCSPNAIRFVAPATVTATVKVADDCKLTKVDFFWVDGTNTSAPGILKRSFITGAVASGTYSYAYTGIPATGQIRVVAYDEVGTRYTEIRKRITTDFNAAPDHLNCRLTQKINGQDVPVSTSRVLFEPTGLMLTAVAYDKTGTVVKMELYNGNTLLATSTLPTSEPTYDFDELTHKYTFKMPLPATLAAGVYTLTIKATDSYGVTTVSNCTNFTLNKCEDSNEPANNTAAGAITLAPIGFIYSKIASTTDADYYKILLQPNTTLKLTGTDAFGNATTTLPADLDMKLYRSDKLTTVIALSENTGTDIESIETATIPSIDAPNGNRSYILKVYGFQGANSTACYRLETNCSNCPPCLDLLCLKLRQKMPVMGADLRFLLTPNPATNEVTLVTAVENAGEYNLAVTDVLGREVKRQALTLNEGAIQRQLIFQISVKACTL
jgi:hypothetical protein